MAKCQVGTDDNECRAAPTVGLVGTYVHEDFSAVGYDAVGGECTEEGCILPVVVVEVGLNFIYDFRLNGKHKHVGVFVVHHGTALVGRFLGNAYVLCRDVALHAGELQHIVHIARQVLRVYLTAVVQWSDTAKLSLGRLECAKVFLNVAYVLAVRGLVRGNALLERLDVALRGAYIGVEGVDAVGVRGLGRAQTLDVGSVLVDVYLNGFEVGGHLLHGFHILGAVNGGVALEQRIAVAVYLCHPFAAVCHIELAEVVAGRTAFYGYQRPPTLMGIGVCLAQLCHGLEKSFARTLDVLGFKPTLHG